MHLKQSFLNMFFCLINNYLMCYRAEKIPNEPPIACNIFDFDMYLGFFDEQRRGFMAELCKTQNFVAFIEKSQKAKEDKNEFLFFVEGVKLCAENGEKALAQKVKRITEQLVNNFKHVFP